jgi:ABC-2 type transport system permease protein
LFAYFHRIRALLKKELNQIRRDRRLAMSLIVPPVLQLTLFGFALSATVENVPLGIVDESKSSESRELISVLTESKSFRAAGFYQSAEQLTQAISNGSLNAGSGHPQ